MARVIGKEIAVAGTNTCCGLRIVEVVLSIEQRARWSLVVWMSHFGGNAVILVGQLSEAVVYSEPTREMPVELQEPTQ